MDEPNMGPRWDADLQKSKSDYVELTSPRTGEKLRVTATSPKIEACWLHYIGGRNQPCLGDRETCYGCQCETGRRWRGFTAGILFGTNRQIIVEITRAAALPFIDRLMGAGAGLRGWPLALWRKGSGRNARVLMEFASRRVDEVQLPPAIDVRSALVKIWGCGGVALRTPKKPQDEPPDDFVE